MPAVGSAVGRKRDECQNRVQQASRRNAFARGNGKAAIAFDRVNGSATDQWSPSDPEQA